MLGNTSCLEMPRVCRLLCKKQPEVLLPIGNQTQPSPAPQVETAVATAYCRTFLAALPVSN